MMKNYVFHHKVILFLRGLLSLRLINSFVNQMKGTHGLNKGIMKLE